jgi:hypothetical protein
MPRRLVCGVRSWLSRVGAVAGQRHRFVDDEPSGIMISG